MGRASAAHFEADARRWARKDTMKISGRGTETFLYVNGLGVARPIRLADDVELLPAQCAPVPDDIISRANSEVDIGVLCIFLRQVQSQLRITAPDAKALATLAWNSIWDTVLLSAFHDCEATVNLQCDRRAEEFSSEAELEITNYHLRGLTDSPRTLDEKEAEWIEEHFEQARTLLDKRAFQNAVHSLATYRWHAHPRAGLALLWSGIEGLFSIESELVYRLSLYTAKFLEPDDADQARQVFRDVKKLYKQRSAAVHGAELKDGTRKAVTDSVGLLQKLIRQCVITGDLPRGDELVL